MSQKYHNELGMWEVIKVEINSLAHYRNYKEYVMAIKTLYNMIPEKIKNIFPDHISNYDFRIFKHYKTHKKEIEKLYLSFINILFHEIPYPPHLKIEKEWWMNKAYNDAKKEIEEGFSQEKCQDIRNLVAYKYLGEEWILPRKRERTIKFLNIVDVIENKNKAQLEYWEDKPLTLLKIVSKPPYLAYLYPDKALKNAMERAKWDNNKKVYIIEWKHNLL